jgi:hypothetical protein
VDADAEAVGLAEVAAGLCGAAEGVDFEHAAPASASVHSNTNGFIGSDLIASPDRRWTGTTFEIAGGIAETQLPLGPERWQDERSTDERGGVIGHGNEGQGRKQGQQEAGPTRHQGETRGEEGEEIRQVIRRLA